MLDFAAEQGWTLLDCGQLPRLLPPWKSDGRIRQPWQDQMLSWQVDGPDENLGLFQ